MITTKITLAKDIQFVGNPCTKYSANGKCNECTGDCDADSDCAGELRCAKRARASQNVPGCVWGLADRNENEVDYCEFVVVTNFGLRYTLIVLLIFLLINHCVLFLS